MKSSHRPLSRALVIGVGSMLALGVVFWLGKLSGSKAAPAKEPTRIAVAVPLPLVDAQPAHIGTTQPVASTTMSSADR